MCEFFALWPMPPSATLSSKELFQSFFGLLTGCVMGQFYLFLKICRIQQRLGLFLKE